MAYNGCRSGWNSNCNDHSLSHIGNLGQPVDLDGRNVRVRDLCSHGSRHGITVSTSKFTTHYGSSSFEVMNRKWFYILDGKREGPLDEVDLQHVFQTNVFPQSTPVWCDGISDWVPASSIHSFCIQPHDVPSHSFPIDISNPYISRSDAPATAIPAPISQSSQDTLNTSNNNNEHIRIFSRYLLLVIGVFVVLLIVACIAITCLQPAWNTSSSTDSKQNNKSKQHFATENLLLRYGELVYKNRSDYGVAQNPHQVLSVLISQLRNIDSANCPATVRSAFNRLITAWENLEEALAGEPASFGEGVFQGFINSLQGEVDGGVGRIINNRQIRINQINEAERNLKAAIESN